MAHFPTQSLSALIQRITDLEAGKTTSVETVDPDYFSDLGQIVGGTSVAAGSTFPAIAGRVIPLPGATTWIKITGTDAQAGDSVLITYEGRRTAAPLNPAARITAAAGPGAPGTNALAAGEIELTLSGSNSDLNYVTWKLIRKGA